MGIDIYARWRGQSKSEKGAQAEAWLSNDQGRIGYLREAYHGKPYATRYLVAEAFDNKGEATIPAKVLRNRLPETLRLAELRERTIYNAGDEEVKRVLQSFTDFVELCEQMGKRRESRSKSSLRGSLHQKPRFGGALCAWARPTPRRDGDPSGDSSPGVTSTPCEFAPP
jgi:hypothetical protein